MTWRRIGLALLFVAAAAGCYRRPASHLPAGMFVPAVEPVDDEAYVAGSGTLRNVNGEPLFPGQGRSIVETLPPPAKKHPPFDARGAREMFARTDVRRCGVDGEGHSKVTLGPC